MTPEEPRPCRVGVVLPVRNRPKLIQTALQSILFQTLAVKEVIVVDDGSNDDTPDVVKQIAQENALIRYVGNHGRRGANGARWCGVQELSEDISVVAFADSDTVWLPQKNWLQSELLSRSGASGVFSGILRDRRVLIPSSEDKVWRSPHELIPRNVVDFPTLMIRRDVLSEEHFSPERSRFQDWQLALDILASGGNLASSNEILVAHLESFDRISHDVAAGVRERNRIGRRFGATDYFLHPQRFFRFWLDTQLRNAASRISAQRNPKCQQP